MGRLFWKFFGFIWLAQLMGIFAIGITFWLTDPRFDRAFEANRAAPSLQSSDRPGPPGPPRGPQDPHGPQGPRMLRGWPPLPPTLATLLASLATALGLAWYVVKPIRSLRGAFAALSSGNLDVRVAPEIGKRHDELADLGREFDRMANRLQVSMNGQRRLLHDVSHEVRSPLARLQVAVGLIRLKFGADEPAVGRIEEEITRIDRLVADLLVLSRIEAGELAGAVEEVDMRELIGEIVEDARFEAQHSGHSVEWPKETEGIVVGRPAMLHGAIVNVVRNALKHASQSARVRIETAIDARTRTYHIRVLDSGPGIPDSELPGLFTPFSRGRDAAADGHGLGLAIARRTMEAHGGTIGASNRSQGGLMVDMGVPLRVNLMLQPQPQQRKLAVGFSLRLRGASGAAVAELR